MGRLLIAGAGALLVVHVGLGAAGNPPAFDSGRAYEHVRKLVALGPRPPGSPGSKAAREYILRTLERNGVKTSVQSFTAETPLGPLPMANVRAVIPGQHDERLLIGGHYDTKLYREFRFVGANDAGSSTAVLLELARVLAARKPLMTIELVFFDGEEALVDWFMPGYTDNTYGSRHYVQALRREGTLDRVGGLILLDMIGDRNLNLRREEQSTDWLTEVIWKTAARLGHTEFVDAVLRVEDDHVPFLKAGIPAVDLIDMDYVHHHTPQDTLDKVSARSLAIVAEVVLEALPEVQKLLLEKR